MSRPAVGRAGRERAGQRPRHDRALPRLPRRSPRGRRTGNRARLAGPGRGRRGRVDAGLPGPRVPRPRRVDARPTLGSRAPVVVGYPPLAGGGRVWPSHKACYHLGQVQLAQGLVDAALETYRQAVEIAATPGRQHPPTACSGHVGAAEVAYQRGDLDDALRHVTDGIPLARNLAYTQPLASWWREDAGVDPADQWRSDWGAEGDRRGRSGRTGAAGPAQPGPGAAGPAAAGSG